MAEVKVKIEKLLEGSSFQAGPDDYLITEDHTIGDITRWLIDKDLHHEVMSMLIDDKFERI